MSAFEHQMFNLVSHSNEGFALFDKGDTLIYANDAYHTQMYTEVSDLGVVRFEDILRRNHAAKRGVSISSGNIDRFVNYMHGVRRSVPYRLFEVDYVDGRWMMISEQLGSDGTLLMRLTDITKRKLLEFNLLTQLSKYQKLALTDELTGLANRRAFKESVNCEITRLVRAQESAALLVVDLDHFKYVNDKHGHNVGDCALAHFATVMKSCIRPSDIIGRIGGEEFAIFLSETDQVQGMDVAQRIRTSISDAPLITDDAKVCITSSIGLASQCDNISFATLYETADLALYEAKSSGRNKVCVYS